jgi:hypothetical protein
MEEIKPREILEKCLKRCNSYKGCCFEINKIEDFYPGKSTCKKCVSNINWKKRQFIKL